MASLRGLARFARPRRPETLPARLARRRLYILPTAFGAYMTAMLFAILLGSLNNSSNSALLFSVIACAMLGIALIQTHQRLVGVRVLSVCALPSHAGDPITLRVTLDHRSVRPRHGIALAMGARRMAVDIPPGEPFHVDLELPAMARGIHPMGRLQVSTRRPLNIAHAWSWVWPDQSFVVYPRLEPHPPQPSGRSQGEDTWRAARVGTNVHHLRDYRSGDALRDIAWKASARQGKLMAREYEVPSGGLCHLRWEDVAHLPTEHALSRLAAWVVTADERGQRTELHLPGGRIGPGQGLAHRHLCLSALAQVPADAFA